MVNSAWVLRHGAMGELDRAAVDLQWAVNVRGTVIATEQVVRHMPDGGRIITLCSTAARHTFTAGLADHAATRAAISAYSRSWAQDLAPRGITSNTISPAFSRIGMLLPESPSGEAGAFVVQLLPLHRHADPEEVAETIGYLASPRAGHVTGADLRVGGDRDA